MTGVVALHGGGEFLDGDEPFLDTLVASVPARAGALRVVVVPTAAARGRPDLAAAHGVAALERAGARAGRRIEAEPILVVDAASAAAPDLSDRLARADLIHLPGGDPDVIPALYPDSRAWAAIREALANGAVLAGASAGAMALGSAVWTPGGVVTGLGLVPRVLVVPHTDTGSWRDRVARFGALVPPGTAVLGLAERTGVLGPPGGPWRIVGEGEVRWLGADIHDVDRTLVRRPGEVLDGPRGEA